MARTATSNPQPDDFVQKVVKDPANPPANVAVLNGFVGASDATDHVRVYSDPSLASFVDVPKDAVLHSEKLPAEQSPLGGSVLWVDGAAPLRSPAPTEPVATAADFLRGGIQADLGATAAAAGGATIHPTLWTQLCPPQTIHPTLWTQLCTHTAATVCTPTHQLGCPRTSTCPPVTSLIGCPNTSTCPHPTALVGCPNTSTCGAPDLGIDEVAGIVGPTGTQGCTMVPHCFGPTGVQGCTVKGPTAWLHCPPRTTDGCGIVPPTRLFGCPSTSTCPPTHSPICGSTIATRAFICPPTHSPVCGSTLVSQICPTNIGCNVTWICGPGGE
jgi:hypothetical protein